MSRPFGVAAYVGDSVDAFQKLLISSTRSIAPQVQCHLFSIVRLSSLQLLVFLQHVFQLYVSIIISISCLSPMYSIGKELARVVLINKTMNRLLALVKLLRLQDLRSMSLTYWYSRV